MQVGRVTPTRGEGGSSRIVDDGRSEPKRTGMKQRKPKNLAEKLDKSKLDKSLRVRYSELVELRELVKKAESEVRGDGKSSDQPHDSLSRRR
jgi:hypothetical protein